MKVTKESIIGEVLDEAPETAKFFIEIGMHCLGCPSARGESIEMACEVHGTDADELVERINEALEAKEKLKRRYGSFQDRRPALSRFVHPDVCAPVSG